MEIMTKKQAMELGFKTYFTGKACKYGHMSERYVSTRSCVKCESVRASSRDMQEIQAKWYQKNSAKAKGYSQEYRKSNRGKCNALSSKRRAKTLNATVAWGDQDAIKRMYIVAEFLTNKLGEPHHVDHIIPLQGKNVSGLHVETNLQVIPARDNLVKGNSYADV